MEIEAVFDGAVFRPTEPVPSGLPPDTRVRIQLPTGPDGIDTAPSGNGKHSPAASVDDPELGQPGSAMRFLASLRLDPDDWEMDGWDGHRVHGPREGRP